MEEYVLKNGKKLRCGYTTGSCAAAAAKAAVFMLLTGCRAEEITLTTPKGVVLNLEVQDAFISQEKASCAIQKDSGDDPDVTHGVLVYAQAQKKEEPGISVEGGQGVGRVTKEGLQRPVGAAAINPVPLKMITSAAEEVCRQQGYTGGLEIIISIPKGEELAKKTYNPRLGIVGGISVLGTSGIVEPMSEAALIETIHLEMRVLAGQGVQYLLVTPGNYGEDYIRQVLGIDLNQGVKCSNYIGEALDCAVAQGFRGLLLVGHVGKIVKVAGGVMNTHSRYADCRMEILAAHAAMAGAGAQTARRLMECITTDEALSLLEQENLQAPVMASVAKKIEEALNYRAHRELQIGAIFFSTQQAALGETSQARELLQKIQSQRQGRN